MTPLRYACYGKKWDLIALLLKHGANPLDDISQTRIFPNPQDTNRFRALVKAHPMAKNAHHVSTLASRVNFSRTVIRRNSPTLTHSTASAALRSHTVNAVLDAKYRSSRFLTRRRATSVNATFDPPDPSASARNGSPQTRWPARYISLYRENICFLRGLQQRKLSTSWGAFQLVGFRA